MSVATLLLAFGVYGMLVQRQLADRAASVAQRSVAPLADLHYASELQDTATIYGALQGGDAPAQAKQLFAEQERKARQALPGQLQKLRASTPAEFRGEIDGLLADLQKIQDSSAQAAQATDPGQRAALLGQASQAAQGMSQRFAKLRDLLVTDAATQRQAMADAQQTSSRLTILVVAVGIALAVGLGW